MGKGKRTTLAAFVKRQPERQTIILRNDLPDNFYNLTDQQKRKAEKDGGMNDYILIKRTNNNALRVSRVYARVKRKGRRYYIFREVDQLFSIHNNKIFTENAFLNINGGLMDKILKAMGVSFELTTVINKIDYTNLNKQTLKSILVGTVYSEETFWKRKMSTSFQLKGVAWKDFRTIMQQCTLPFSDISDLKDFTTNYAYSFRRVARAIEERDFDFLRLVHDMLCYAVSEGTNINLKWSAKRMEAEHPAPTFSFADVITAGGTLSPPSTSRLPAIITENSSTPSSVAATSTGALS